MSTKTSVFSKGDHRSLLPSELNIKEPITKLEDLNKQGQVLETQLVLPLKQITQVLGSRVCKNFEWNGISDDIVVMVAIIPVVHFL